MGLFEFVMRIRDTNDSIMKKQPQSRIRITFSRLCHTYPGGQSGHAHSALHGQLVPDSLFDKFVDRDFFPFGRNGNILVQFWRNSDIESS